MSCTALDFPAVYPWAECAPKPPRLEAKDYTGCECHDAPNESWFNEHLKGKDAPERDQRRTQPAA